MYNKKTSSKSGKGVGGSCGKDQFSIKTLEDKTNSKKRGSQPKSGRSIV